MEIHLTNFTNQVNYQVIEMNTKAVRVLNINNLVKFDYQVKILSQLLFEQLIDLQLVIIIKYALRKLCEVTFI